LNGHANEVHSVVLSADGKFAVSGGADGTVRIWEVPEGRCLRTFKGHTGQVVSVALSECGRYVLSGSGDGTARLWLANCVDKAYMAPLLLSRVSTHQQVSSDEERYRLQVRRAKGHMHNGEIIRALECLREARSVPEREYHPDALQEWRNLYVRLPRVSLRTAWKEKRFEGIKLPIHSACFSADSRYVLSGGGDFLGEIKLWEVETGHCVRKLKDRRFLLGAMDIASSVSLSQNMRRAVSGTPFGTVVSWDATGGQCVTTLGYPRYGTISSENEDVVLPAIMNLVVRGTECCFYSLVNVLLRRWESIRAARAGHKGTVFCVCLTPDAQYALSAGADKTIKLWHLESGRCLRTLKGHNKPVFSIALSADGQYAVSGGDDHELMFWDLASGQYLYRFQPGIQALRTVSLASDSLRALTGGFDGELHLWDVVNSRSLATLKGHTEGVLSTQISSDGRYAISGGLDKSVRFWDLETGECLQTLHEHKNAVSTVAFSPNGQYAVSGSLDGEIILWALDWDLFGRPATDWNEGARQHLVNFLTLHTPYGGFPSGIRRRDRDAVAVALRRVGKASWSEEEFESLLYTLGCAGYGWLQPEGVRQELEKMNSTWTGPQGLAAHGLT